MAIDIAQACEVREVQGQLADSVLDSSDDMTVRVEAAYAVRSIGDESSRQRLRPLLADNLKEDTEDELKGCALRSLWPGLIAATDIFQLLTFPKKENVFGSYAGFLLRDLVGGLAPDDLPVALRWAAALGDPRQLPHTINGVIDQLFLRACDELERAGIAEALAEGVWARVDAHEGIVGTMSQQEWCKSLAADVVRRRSLVRALLYKLTSVPPITANRLFYANPPLLMADDLPWLIEQVEREASPATRSTLARAMRAVFHQYVPESPDAIVAAAERHQEVADAFRDLLMPVTLDSPAALAARESHAELLSYQQRSRTTRTLQLPPRERIEQLLESDEAGDPDAWWQLTHVMTLKPTSTYIQDASRSDLTALPGWQQADANTRARMLEAAHRYVLERSPSPDEWFYQEETTYEPDEAAFKAFRLQRDQSPSRFEALGPEVWRKWVPAIVGYRAYVRDDDEVAQQRLAGSAFKHAPSEVRDWTSRWLAEQNRRTHPFITARLWAEYSVPELNAVLMERVRDSSIKVAVLETLLNDLLVRNVPEARAFATSLVGAPIPSERSARGRSLAAARSLLNCAPDAGWSNLQLLLHEAPDFGRDLIGSIAHTVALGASAPFLARLTEAEVADLYVWLVRQFPHSEDEEHNHVHGLTHREYIERLRDGTLQHLQHRGTTASLDAIRGIARTLPHLTWLPLVLLDAETVVLERTWVPHSPKDMWALAGNREVRLVDGGAQLLGLTVESIRRFQEKLRGETPAAFMLWDKQPDGRYRPKEEERLSDALKLHIKDDLGRRGIIANREVVIRSYSGGKAGERTDIHVDAITRGRRHRVFDKVSVIIEVKGCWNRDVRAAMKSQLRDRYMFESDCRNGLYVVGWFLCDQWDAADDRKREARRLLPPSLPEAESLFSEQALEVSDKLTRIDGVVIDCSLT